MASYLTSPAYLAYIRSRQELDWQHMGYWASGMVGMMAIVSIGHWSNRVFGHGSGGFSSVVRATNRTVRSIGLRRVPLFDNVGRLLVYTIYLAINLIIAFVGVTWADTTTNDWAKRMGWVSVANLTLVTFLALKNTPLAFLTSYSYNRLNCLHRLAGITLLFSAVIHGASAISAFKGLGVGGALTQRVQIMGPVAAMSVLITVLTATIVRNYFHEAFYVVHVTLFVLILIALSLHRPGLTNDGLATILFVASMFFLDRVVRFTRLLYHSFGSTAAIQALPNGGVKVVLNKSFRRIRPGCHAFLWIPAVRALETHPFTIVGNDPLQFIIKPQAGFTKDLLQYATKNPGAVVRASFEGPYGDLPDFPSFDKVMLVAGGSGASFTCGVAVDLVRNTTKKIDFVLAVPHPENLSWYAEELNELRASSLVNIEAYITREDTYKTVDGDVKDNKADAHCVQEPSVGKETAMSDVEKLAMTMSKDVECDTTSNGGSSIALVTSLKPQSGRPNMSALVAKVAEESAAAKERLIIASCGPSRMMDIVQEEVRLQLGMGRDVALCVEKFE